MNFISFTLGIIVGMLVAILVVVRISFLDGYRTFKKSLESLKKPEQSQFIEPESIEENLAKAKTIGEFIKKL